MQVEKKNSAARIRANNRYNEKAYDRINIAVPKGQKAAIQAAAEQVGESINAYVNKAVQARMGLEEWPAIPREE
jgi:predicted HicB family RNase H-like nuclease